MKHFYKMIAFFAVLTMTKICYGQNDIISSLQRELDNYQIKTGDTCIFKFSRDYERFSNHILFPYAINEKTINIPDEALGYFYSTPHPVSSTKKRTRIYHQKQIFSQGREIYGTPTSDISNIPLVVLHVDNGNPHHIDYYLYNTRFLDTLLLRVSPKMRNKIHEPDTILVYGDNTNQILKDKFVGEKFYCTVWNEDTSLYDKKIMAINSITGIVCFEYYREYTVTRCDCKIIVSGESKSNKIDILYCDKYGICHKTSYYQSIQYFPKDMDSLQDVKLKEIEQYRKEEQARYQQEIERKKKEGNYHFVISKVDKPKNANVRKGILTKDGIYEDSFISINWTAMEQEMTFMFSLKNMTNNTMKLIWDEALIVNFDGFTERVLHKGADLESLQKSQQPAIIPPLAQLADFYCSEKYFGRNKLRYGYGGGDNCGYNDGKEMRLILPIQIGKITYTYTFIFKLKWEWKYPEIRDGKK